MEIFGPHWTDYERRLKDNWNSKIRQNDTVLICGDISWVTYLKDALDDFKFLDSLNGRKIISKGNHDYWWSTLSKNKKFVESNFIHDILFLHNNSYRYLSHDNRNIAICGTRGWVYSDKNSQSIDRLTFERECRRLKISLDSINKQCDSIIVMLHYPPEGEIIEIINQYPVEICLFGHLHNLHPDIKINKRYDRYSKYGKPKYYLVAADFLNFDPKFLI